MEVTVSAFPGRLRLRPEGDAPHTGVLDGKAEFNCFFMTSPVEMNAAEDVADSGRKCDSGVSQR